MADMTYLDFDLQIERTANGYRARALNSPAGQAEAEFTQPFTAMELENLLLRVGRTRRMMRRVDSPELSAVRVFGSKLFETVFSGDLRAALRSSLDEAGHQNARLRLRLRLTAVPELADWPWEYLYDSSLNRFLALSVDSPLVRYLELPERIRPLAIQPPLKLLAIIASPGDHPPLDVEREWQNLQRALAPLSERGLLWLERLSSATLPELQQQLRREDYHIFHFIGHGGFDAQAQEGVLLFEDEQGRGRKVGGNMLGVILRDERTFRLAVLNACEGARAASDDSFSGMAQALVQQGLPAVIAMQFEVSDEAAIIFAQRFYEAITDGYPVDAALSETRKAIYATNNEIEWGTPVLYMRASDGKLFEVDHTQQLAAEAEAKAAAERAAREQEQQRAREAAEQERQEQMREEMRRLARERELHERRELVVVQPPLKKPSGRSKWWLGAIAVLMALCGVCGGGAYVTGLLISPTPTRVAGLPATATFTPARTPTPLIPTARTNTPTATPSLRPTATPTPRSTSSTTLLNVTGRWYTNFATMSLTQSGTTVRGTYTWYGGSVALAIEGTLSGQSLKGFYQGDRNKEFAFTFSDDGQSFDGTWESQYDWCGVRSGALPDGCGFSGHWETCCEDSPVLSRQPTADLVQVDDDVMGTFFNGRSNGIVKGKIGTNGSGSHYTLKGTYTVDGYTNEFRWTLVDFNSRQFQGIWKNNTGDHPWCGWRSRSSKPSPCQK